MNLTFKNFNFSKHPAIFVPIIIIVLVFLVLGITSQVYFKKLPVDAKQDLLENIKFWVGNNGIVLSALIYIVVALAIVMIIKVVKYMPIWTEDLKSNGSTVVARIDEITKQVSTLSTSSTVVLEKLNKALDAFISNNGAAFLKDLTTKK